MTIIVSTHAWRYAAPVLVALALVACGGGGSDTPVETTAASTSFPLAAALASYAKDTRTAPFTVSGTGAASGPAVAISGGGNISSSISAGTFEGVAAQVKTLTTTATLTAQGTSTPIATTSVVFYDANYLALGTSSASSYCVSSGSGGLPTSAKIGDTGVWYSSTCYSNSSKSVRTLTATSSYSIEPLTATTALLRVTQKSTPLTGVASSLDLTYTISTAGALSPRETPFTIAFAGITFSLVFKFS